MDNTIKFWTSVNTAPERVIYKYEIEQGGATVHKAHWAEILDAQVQNDKIVIWAAVAPYKKDFLTGEVFPKEDSHKTEATFLAIGTGWPYDNNSIGQYFRTVQTPDGLVWHIFVRGEE